ncbi:thermonuclease family protein [Paenibacillus soyae]|uniref:Thermonuclease family protein n=1 Tax=Paenibacillus soyae TaxID=2969249 RepID=A0A9X2MMZ3_9BACL|nr:thermonuclease family protein [Paenibacillus soyae]MCR2804898.1 thermonuclease family protein [Paenibacillus soyae]
MRYTFIIPFLIMLVIITAGCSGLSSTAAPSLKSDTWYPVSGFVDGDTFRVKTGDQETTIRLLYVDTPETKKPDTPVQPFGPEAAAFTKQRLEESGEVKLSFDKETKDHYDRTLAVVELKDGSILNELLLEQGLAKVLIVEPNVKMENVYKQLEQSAKQNAAGLWSSGNETSQTELPERKVQPIGLEMKVDKAEEMVTITNTTFESINMDDWKLVSVRGNQTYTFEPIELPGQAKLILLSGTEEPDGLDAEALLLEWEVDNVWNNMEPDPAELYNEKNELVALWEDE